MPLRMQLGYLSKDPETKIFRLTPKWIRFGLRVLNDLDIRNVAYPHLRKLNEETNETVSMGIIYEGAVIIIERFEAGHILAANIKPGVRRPIHTNSIGKVILAFQDENKIMSLRCKVCNTSSDTNQISYKIYHFKRNY